MAEIMSEETKYELAKELGFAHKVQDGDWGDITTREAGSLVRAAIEKAEEAMSQGRLQVQNYQAQNQNNQSQNQSNNESNNDENDEGRDEPNLLQNTNKQQMQQSKQDFDNQIPVDNNADQQMQYQYEFAQPPHPLLQQRLPQKTQNTTKKM